MVELTIHALVPPDWARALTDRELAARIEEEVEELVRLGYPLRPRDGR